MDFKVDDDWYKSSRVLCKVLSVHETTKNAYLFVNLDYDKIRPKAIFGRMIVQIPLKKYRPLGEIENAEVELVILSEGDAARASSIAPTSKLEKEVVSMGALLHMRYDLIPYEAQRVVLRFWDEKQTITDAKMCWWTAKEEKLLP